MSKKCTATIDDDNKITLPDGTTISIHGVDQRIKHVGFTMAPLTTAAPDLLKVCKWVRGAFQEIADENSVMNIATAESIMNRLSRVIADAEGSN